MKLHICSLLILITMSMPFAPDSYGNGNDETYAIEQEYFVETAESLPDIASVMILPSRPTIATKAPLPSPSDLKPIKRSEKQMWWLNQLRLGTLNLQDTAVIYPKFVKFCVDAYNWADNFFNHYDPEYVVSTGKRWKARIVNDNWVDSYILNLPDHLRTNMLSDLYANFGGYIQYMAISVGFTVDFNKIFGNKPIDHRKWEFGFNCARFNVEAYYHENTGGTYLRKFGNYNDGRHFKMRFPGVTLKNFGIEGVYFFNHEKYSQGAAYNFSKIQKKSQGSFLAGFTYNNLRINFDFTQLPDALKPYLTIPAQQYLFHYNSYAVVVGYGFNCVINDRLLYNITVNPSFGVAHCFADSFQGEKYMFAMNFAGRTSLTYNLGNWFFSIIGKINGQLYHSGKYTLFSSVENFSANIGIRF